MRREPMRAHRLTRSPFPAGPALALLMLPGLSVPSALAQEVTGRVVQGPDDDPVGAAWVFLMDGSERVAAGDLTDAGGSFALVPAEPGHYALHVSPSGFADVRTPAFAVAGGEHLDFVVEVPLTPCPGKEAGDPAALVQGTVRQWGTERPAARARVIVEWRDEGEGSGDGVGRLEVAADDQGRYAACPVPRGSLVSVRAESAEGVSEREWVELLMQLSAEQDLAIGRPDRVVALEEIDVAVMTELEERRRVGTVGLRVVADEDLASFRERGATVIDLLRARVPGIRVVEGRFATLDDPEPRPMVCVEYARGRDRLELPPELPWDAELCEMVAVVVDGTEVQDPGSYLRNLSVEQFRSVEVIAPLAGYGRFGMNAHNGVISLETQDPRRGTRPR